MMRVALALCMLVSCCAPAFAGDIAPESAGALTPLQLFIKTRQTWKARPLPPFIRYHIAGEFNRKRKHVTADYEVTYRTSDRQAMTVSLPHSAREKVERTFGPPRISPDATFGVAPRAGYASDAIADSGSPAPGAQPAASPATTIGRVTAIVKIPYDMSLDPDEKIGERTAYHLILKPQREPEIYRLRELWIDKQTFDVVHLCAVAIAHIGVIRQPFVYDAFFKPVDAYWMVDKILASGRIRVMLFQYGGSGDLTFPDIQFPTSVPEWTFDKKLFEEHEKATKAAAL